MLDFDQQGHIVTLTINRPDMRNALGEPGDGGVFQMRWRVLMTTAMCAVSF